MTQPKGNPQLEHGHTRIANELLEALIRYPFSGGELKVVLAVIRLTYGWRRTERAIRQQDLATTTGLDPRHIRRTLTTLRQQGVLFRDHVTRPHTFRLNKAYFGWRDWPPEMAADMAALSADMAALRQQVGCELSAQADRKVRLAEDRSVLPTYKEKKENVRYTHERGDVDNPSFLTNLLHRFREFLKRPLDAEEHALVRRLHALSPAQAQRLLEDVAAGRRHTLTTPEVPHA